MSFRGNPRVTPKASYDLRRIIQRVRARARWRLKQSNEPDTPSGESARPPFIVQAIVIFFRKLSDESEPRSALQIPCSESYTEHALVSPCAPDVAPYFHRWLSVPVPRIICWCCANQPRAQFRACQRRSHFETHAAFGKTRLALHARQGHRRNLEERGETGVVETFQPLQPFQSLHRLNPESCEVSRPPSSPGKVQPPLQGSFRSAGHGAHQPPQRSVGFRTQCADIR
jgi:hypothetical protein